MNKIALAICSIALTATAQADVLFENGTLNNFSGGNNPFSYNSQLVTDDFFLSSDATLRSVTFNAFTTSSTVPVTDVLVKIFANNSGSIGTELFSSHLGVAHTAVTGGDGYFSFTDYAVNLPNLNLAAGNYWLGLSASPAQWDLHWSIPNSGYGATGSDGHQHYFRIENVAAVPEPETYAMFLAGLGIMGTMVRRRKGTKAS